MPAPFLNQTDEWRLLAQALEKTANRVVITDKNGVIVWANPAITAMTGYGPEELIGRTPSIFKSGRHGDEYYQNLWRTILDGRVWHGQMTNRRKDGSLYIEEQTITPLRGLDGAISHFISIKADITERERAKQALRKANRAYRILSKTNRSLTQARDERSWLERMCQIIVESGGYKMAWVGYASIDGKDAVKPIAWAGVENGYLKALQAAHANDPLCRGALCCAMRTKTPIVRLDIRNEPAPPPWRDEALKRGYASVAALPLMMRDQVFGAVAIYAAEPDAFTTAEMRLLGELASDAAFGVASLRARAQQESAEQALRESEQQLRQAQKMEAVGRLAGGVAHDFNNLLTAILGYCQFLKADFKSNPSALGDLEEVIAAAQRAAGLTQQLLAFSRKQVLSPRVTDLNGIVLNIDKMLRRIIGEDIELRLHLAPELKRVKVDPGQMEQVIMNLAVNARDAMPGGGKLLIETANVVFDESSPGRHDVIPPGAYAMLAVSDTGSGMDEATKAHLFEPFFTTKEKGKGTGLGLSTIYGIVKQSGGYIWVYSELGRGTAFKVYFPVTESAADLGGAEPAPAESLKGSETILFVEDDNSVRDLLTRALSLNGYQVIVAKNGTEGLKIYAARAGEIDLVVTDVVMPNGGGKAMGDRLKAVRPDVRIIYMSGYTDEAVVRHGELGPGTVFLQKPLIPNALLAKIRQVLDKKPD